MNKWIASVGIHNNVHPDLHLLFSKMDIIQFGTCSVYFERDGRFMDDQIFSETENEIWILDGVILNLKELKEEHSSENVEDLVKKLSRIAPDSFFSRFIGPFCGIRYDKLTGQMIAFCNQTGDAPLFYYHSPKWLLVSNDVNLIVDTLNS